MNYCHAQKYSEIQIINFSDVTRVIIKYIVFFLPMILWEFYGAVFHQLSSVLRQFLTGHLKVYLVADMFPLSSHSLHFYMFYLSLECQQLPSLIPITLPPPHPLYLLFGFRIQAVQFFPDVFMLFFELASLSHLIGNISPTYFKGSGARKLQNPFFNC